ncbi:MAG: hypothetical protein ACI9NY_000970 [Kiritimatiellia bacterium]|jgi:uncharacterized protein YggE
MKLKALVYVLLACLLMVVSFGSLSEAVEPSIAQLFVRGEAQLMVPPDQVSAVLGITTEAPSAKKAITENSKKMQSVFRSLTKLGLTEENYKTQNFYVQPVWSSRPKGANSSWKAKIIAYRVNNSIRLTTQVLDNIGDVIAATTAAGANQVSSISFSLSDERQYRSQAITQAMANAKIDAQTLASASGDKIKRTMSLHLDNASASRVKVQAPMEARRLMTDQSAFSPPPISSGDIMVRASVSVVYELE